jgi:type IV secretory pathway TrbD component
LSIGVAGEDFDPTSRRHTVSSSVIELAKRTNAVESGFLAAGLTVSAVAGIQSLFGLLSWMISG